MALKKLPYLFLLIKVITIAFLSVLVFILYFHQIDAMLQDLGRHLLFGEIIVQTQHVPTINLLSYTYPNFPFINTHWLSEVIFYLIEKSTGFFGLLIFTSLVATMAFLIQLLYLKNIKTLPLLLASVLYFRILLERTDLRPEIFSFFYMSLFIVILYKYREKFTQWIYILPLIELVWINSHIYYPAGIVILLFFLVDALITYRKKIFQKYTLTLFFVLVATIIATLINPNTINGALYPFNIFHNYGFQIAENYNVFQIWNQLQPKSTILYYFISVPLLFSLMLITFKKTKPIDWFLALFFTIFAASALRNLPLFVFATFIPFAKSLNSLYGKLFPDKAESFIKVTLYISVCLFLIWQVKDIITAHTFGYQMPTEVSKSVDFIQENNIKGPMFNNFDIGSYLAYRLYPKEKVFVDGRPEAYPASFFQNIYIPIEQDKTIFQKADNKYLFNMIIISHSDLTPSNQQFLRDINANPNWKLVYLDPTMVIYVKNIPQNKSIKTNIITSPNVSSMNFTKQELMQLLAFYQNIGWSTEIKVIDNKLLDINPNDCSIIANLGTILQNENDQQYLFYAEKYQRLCMKQ